ncbi:MAG: helix-turn-helix transcriptional regulator [Verrucomicrobiota bacterium]
MGHKPPHLVMQQIVLSPGRELTHAPEHWSFVRSCAGAGYALGTGQNRSLAAGDVLLVAANSEVCLRGSQLGQWIIYHFEVWPADLPGLFTLADEQSLARAAKTGSVVTRHFPANSVTAAHFSDLCQLHNHRPGTNLVLRAEMLRLAAHVLSELAAAQPLAPSTGLEQRFRALLDSRAAAELMTQSAPELAAKCGCSKRHFRRLFLDHFGVSLVTWQIQLRIRKAMRLLQQSDAKVVDVALESGFQHLGQFNTTFKRIVGVTPSAWRKTRPPRLLPTKCPQPGTSSERARPLAAA